MRDMEVGTTLTRAGKLSQIQLYTLVDTVLQLPPLCAATILN